MVVHRWQAQELARARACVRESPEREKPELSVRETSEVACVWLGDWGDWVVCLFVCLVVACWVREFQRESERVSETPTAQ